MVWLAKLKQIKTLIVTVIKLTPTDKDDKVLKDIENKIKDIFK